MIRFVEPFRREIKDDSVACPLQLTAPASS
jgi:hypothetical protein